jgi:hypothetical protein
MVAARFVIPDPDGGTEVVIAAVPRWTDDPDLAIEELVRDLRSRQPYELKGGTLEFRGLFEGPTFALVIDPHLVAEAARFGSRLSARLDLATESLRATNEIGGRIQTSAQFTITSDSLDPVAVTEYLGLTPDHTFRAGQQIGKSKAVSRIGGWELSIPPGRSQTFISQFDQLTERLRGKSELIHRFCRDHVALARFEFVGHFVSMTPELDLSVQRLKQVSATGAGIWLDLIQVDRIKELGESAQNQ